LKYKGNHLTENRTKAERKVEILEAALNIFVKKGYAETRMDDIVQESGLSKGAIYWHYKNKRELFLSLIDHWLDQFAPIMSPGYHAGKKAEVILKDIARFTVRIFNRNRNWFLAEIEFWAMASRDEEVREKGIALYNGIISEIESVLRKGIRKGEFLEIDTRQTALMLMNNLQGIIWFVLFKDETFSVDDYIKGSMEMMLRGIVKS
jgi:AcrR family transcriptional regulator